MTSIGSIQSDKVKRTSNSPPHSGAKFKIYEQKYLKAISGTSLVLGPIPDSSNFLLKCLLFSKIILCKFLDPQSF